MKDADDRTQSSPVRSFGYVDLPHQTVDEVKFAVGSWLSDLELNIAEIGSNELAVVGITVKGARAQYVSEFGQHTAVRPGQRSGSKRLLLPGLGHGIVGLKGEVAGGIVTRLGLLEAASRGIDYTLN